jgi:hypothetical protein
VGKLVVTVRGEHKGFAPLPLFLAAMVSLVGFLHATGRSCVAVLSLLALVFAAVGLAYAYLCPMRVPLWNFTSAASELILALIALINALSGAGALRGADAVVATAALSALITLLSVVTTAHRTCVTALEMFLWSDPTVKTRKASTAESQNCVEGYDPATQGTDLSLASRGLHIFRGLNDRSQRLELLIVAITNFTKSSATRL